MNLYFLPNDEEQGLIQSIQKYCRNEFTLIRMTDTMLKKSIIDASEPLRLILKESGIADYGDIMQGIENKIIKKAYVFNGSLIDEQQMSLYRPETKSGDPRIWIYGLKQNVTTGVLLYITTLNSSLVVIPLIIHDDFEKSLISYFGVNEEDDLILNELQEKLSILKTFGWIESVSPFKSSPKDVGDTLERYLGIKPNNIVSADYRGEIELKCKRLKGSNLDTLFSMVPNWEISALKSSAEIMFKYGYPSNKYEGYQDLYVTVNNRPNNQGLYMDIDDATQLVFQRSLLNNIIEEVCIWEYGAIRSKLNEKHPKTCWIVADEKEILGKIHFHYISVELTQKPIFSQFTTLIGQGIVSYDWRGRVRLDSTGYKDKGHCFRVAPRNRNLLFGEVKDLKI